MTFAPVRQARAEEAGAVSGLLQACGRDLQERLGLRNWAIPYPLARIEEQIGQGHVWVTEEEGLLIGTFTLDFDLPGEYEAQWFAEPSASAGYLHRLAAHPRQQGRGLGSFCLREAERLTREAGHEYLRFDAYSRNSGALQFYERHGFARLREFEMFLRSLGQMERFTLFERRLR